MRGAKQTGRVYSLTRAKKFYFWWPHPLDYLITTYVPQTFLVKNAMEKHQTTKRYIDARLQKFFTKSIKTNFLIFPAYKYYLRSPGTGSETFYKIAVTLIIIDGIKPLLPANVTNTIIKLKVFVVQMIHKMIRTNEPAQRSSIFSIFSWKTSRSFTLSGLLLKIRP